MFHTLQPASVDRKECKWLYIWSWKIFEFILFISTLFLILTKFMRTYSTVQR